MKLLLNSLIFLCALGAVLADPVLRQDSNAIPPAPDAVKAPAHPEPDVPALIKERDALKAQVEQLQQAISVTNARLTELEKQRNEALNQVAIARADLALAQQAAREKKP